MGGNVGVRESRCVTMGGMEPCALMSVAIFFPVDLERGSHTCLPPYAVVAFPYGTCLSISVLAHCSLLRARTAAEAAARSFAENAEDGFGGANLLL